MQSLASGGQQEARLLYCLCLWVVDQERNLVHASSSVHSEELEGVVEMVGLRGGLLPRKMGELRHSHKDVLVVPLFCWLLNCLIIARLHCYSGRLQCNRKMQTSRP